MMYLLERYQQTSHKLSDADAKEKKNDVSPACCRAAGMANAGPIPMRSGGTPTTALALRTPSTGSPRASAAARRPSSTAAAPSLTWLELPEDKRPGLSLAVGGGREEPAAAEEPAHLPWCCRRA